MRKGPEGDRRFMEVCRCGRRRKQLPSPTGIRKPGSRGRGPWGLMQGPLSCQRKYNPSSRTRAMFWRYRNGQAGSSAPLRVRRPTTPRGRSTTRVSVAAWRVSYITFKYPPGLHRMCLLPLGKQGWAGERSSCRHDGTGHVWKHLPENAKNGPSFPPLRISSGR